ncbi:hypothetical protein DV738_g2023, partial [Chaetothyriales sp. CBS 135597]
MSAQNSAGIQTLLDAEKEAQKIVHKGHRPLLLSASAMETDSSQQENVRSNWRRMSAPTNDPDRTKRVKDAKTEAQKEIEEYRKKKEEEYKKFEVEQSSGNKKAEEEANKEAEVALKEIDAAGKKSGKKVVEDLIKTVTTPRPEVPDKLLKEE